MLELEGKSATAAMHEGYLRRFWTWITTTDVTLKGAEFAVKDAAKLVIELKDRPSLRAQVRQTVAAHLPRFLDEAHEELRLLKQRAIRLGFSGGLAVIFGEQTEKRIERLIDWSGGIPARDRSTASALCRYSHGAMAAIR